MSARINAAIRAVEAVQAEPFGDRRKRLWDRAWRIVRELHGAELGPDEHLALSPLYYAMGYGQIRRPYDYPLIHAVGSKRKALRIAKRETKRNTRRAERRQGVDVVRADSMAADDHGALPDG